MPRVAPAATPTDGRDHARSLGVEHEAEGVPGRVGVHAEVLGVRRIGQTTGAQSQHLPFRLVHVVHLDVEVKLLRTRRVGPMWRDVVRSQLDREADIAALERRPVVRAVSCRSESAESAA